MIEKFNSKKYEIGLIILLNFFLIIFIGFLILKNFRIVGVMFIRFGLLSLMFLKF